MKYIYIHIYIYIYIFIYVARCLYICSIYMVAAPLILGQGTKNFRPK